MNEWRIKSQEKPEIQIKNEKPSQKLRICAVGNFQFSLHFLSLSSLFCSLHSTFWITDIRHMNGGYNIT